MNVHIYRYIFLLLDLCCLLTNIFMFRIFADTHWYCCVFRCRFLLLKILVNVVVTPFLLFSKHILFLLALYAFFSFYIAHFWSSVVLRSSWSQCVMLLLLMLFLLYYCYNWRYNIVAWRGGMRMEKLDLSFIKYALAEPLTNFTFLTPFSKTVRAGDSKLCDSKL